MGNINKSDILRQLKDSYPNFSALDLNKFFSIFINEIKQSLKQGHSVELRNYFSLSIRTQKKSVRRNPKTGEAVEVPEKKVIYFRMSHELKKLLNDEK